MRIPDHRVVVTGLGATTPLGGNVGTTWDAMLAGRSAVRLLEHDWASDISVRIAAEAAVEPSEFLPPEQTERINRSSQFALIAAHEAWADAGFTAPAGTGDSPEPERLGVVIAAAMAGITSFLEQYDILKEQGAGGLSPYAVPMMLHNAASAGVGIELNARAGVHSPTSACSSGAEAIGYGMEMIRSGRADVVLAGGTEAAICAFVLVSFGNMMAMTKRNDDPATASRPYDVARNGFVLGEGSGVLVLESAEHAERRGARVYAELVGQGISADAHHMTQPDPTGSGVAAALQSLMDTSDLKPMEITHVNAHATSTPQGDVAELKALRTVFGDDTDQFAISATKSMTGHLLGGAGGIETVFSVLALHHRLAPPTINVKDLDPEVDADIVRDEPRALPDGRIACLNNSFGMGGHNVVLGLRTM